MGGTARTLAVGLAIGSLPLKSSVFATDSRLRATASTLPTPREGCGLRVSLSGEAASCGGGAGCDNGSSDRQPAHVEVLVGSTRREADILSNVGLTWREMVDFGCVHGRDPMTITVYDKLLHPLADCHVGPPQELLSGEERICTGGDGVQFYYAVEHEMSPLAMERSMRRQVPRVLQSSLSPTAAGITDAPVPVIPPTPAPVIIPTPAPVAETDEPIALTEAPIAPTPRPTTPEPTPAPVTITVKPVTPEPTPAPVTPTAAPRTPKPTPAPVALTPAPTTPEPTARPTTPEPTLAPVGTIPSPSPVAVPTTAPTPKPTTKPTTEPTPAPVDPLGTEQPVVQPTVKPTPERTPNPLPTPPVTAAVPRSTSQPVIAPTPTPSAVPADVTAKPSTSPPATSPVDATEAPVATQAPVTLTPVGEPTASPVAPAGTVLPVATPTPLPTPAPAPLVTTETPGTPLPTPVPVQTPSPSSDEECAAECTGLDTSSIWSGVYLDSRCEDDDLPGCGLVGSEANSNCRYCLINAEEYAAEQSTEVEWPDCPCCVAEAASMDPQTDECEAGTPSPSPSVPQDEKILSDEDPDLMVLSFTSEDCTAAGIAVFDGGDSILEVEGYTGDDGECGKSFSVLTGTLCDSDGDYSWNYTGTSYTYSYTCNEESTSVGRRRRLQAENVLEFTKDEVLCNTGLRFYSLSELENDKNGIMYATDDANDFLTSVNLDTDVSGNPYCQNTETATSAVLVEGVDNVLGVETDEPSEGDDIELFIIIPAVCALVVLMICGCVCCFRHRKGKEGRADQMRRNLGYTPDMEAKGEGNFGPTNKHVAITRGGGPQVTPEMLATKTYQPNYAAQHQRAPSEAPSSIIEDNIANNYRPTKAKKNWEKRKVHKELTKPASQQFVIGAGPTSEELKAEDAVPKSQSGRSEQLSERSLNQLELNARNQSGAHPSAAQAQYGYNFEDADREVDGDDDDDARSAATGMSGPSKYAPSGYAPSSHNGGVTHDLMSQYEPSVYEADSQYDPSLYGRESEYGDESSSYSFNQSSQRGGYGHHGGGSRGRGGHGHHISGRASVADTAAMSHLGSVMEMDDSGETNSAYAPSESYVSSYVSSEDDDGRPARSIHPNRGADPTGRSPTEGYTSRHNAHRSGREQNSAGRSGFSASSAGGSSRHSGGRSGFEGDSRDFDEEDSVMHNIPVSMEDLEYYSEDNPSSRDAPLTDVDESHNGQRW